MKNIFISAKKYSICISVIVVLLFLFGLVKVPSFYKKRYRAAKKAEQRLRNTAAIHSTLYSRSSPSSKHNIESINCLRNIADEVLIPDIKFLLYVICHDDESERVSQIWAECRPWAVVIKIPTTPFFESIAYRTSLPFLVHEWEKLDYVAMATYRSVHIMGGVDGLRQHLLFAQAGKFDVVPLVYTREQLMAQAIGGHSKQFTRAWDATLTALGFSEQSIRQADQTEAFFRNSFIVKPHIMKDIIKFMNRAIEASLLDPILSEILESDSEYKAPTPGIAVRVFGTPYYQWHPFIFERLPVFYCFINKISVVFRNQQAVGT